MMDVTPDQSLEDSRVFRAIEEYLAAIQTGRTPDRAQFLARYPDIANRLSDCLAALEAVEAAAPSTPDSAPTLAPGTVLGGFRILHELGRGGMGVVYLAVDARLSRLVALKVMGRTAASSTVARQRFVREAQSASRMRHDHIITIYHADEDGGVPFLAMEFLDGESLEDRLGRGPIALDDAVRIALQTADGLGYAHERGLIHRDIKPANLFLEKATGSSANNASACWPWRVKILDFGLAKVAESDGRLTESGMSLGTPHYMSPEQAAGDAVDPRSDLFSLGCVLYRMLTGVVPFHGDTLRGTIRAVIMDAPTSPRQLRRDVPESLADLTLRLLAKDPAQRPESAAAVQEVLRQIEARAGGVGDSGLRKAASTMTNPIQRSTQRKLLAAAVVGFAVVLAVIGLVASGAFRGVSEETNPSKPAAAAHSQSPPAPLEDAAEPFVVRSPESPKTQSFASLRDAIKHAASGATIEIHGNGPFVYDRVSLSGKMLVLRAGPGFRPVLRQRADAKTDRLSDPFLLADRPLVLEGLEIQRFSSAPANDGWQGCTVVAKDAALYVTHCRFVSDTEGNSHVLNAHGSHIEVRNSLVLTRRNAGFGQVRGDKMGLAKFHNNVFFGGSHPLRVSFADEYTPDFVITFAKNTMIGQGPDFALITEPKTITDGNDRPRVYVEATDNIIDCTKAAVPYVTCFSQHQAAAWNQPGARLMPTADAEVYFRKRVSWKEQRNLYPTGVRVFGLFLGSSDWKSSTLDVLDLANWNKFMGLASTGSTQGPIRYQNNGLPTNQTKSLLEFTPADFRLASDSAGKGMDKNGNDVGADVDQIGPGPAYEAWKQTPAYQQWLKVTRQKK